MMSAVKENELGAIIEPARPGLAPILAVHDAGMVEYLQDAYAQHRACSEAGGPLFPTFFPPPGQRRRPSCFEGRKGFYCTNMGVPIGPHTWHAALVSAQCAVTGAERLGSGESHIYAMCRPPGHHAGPNFFGGYCYLNNAAIAAKFLRKRGGRVAILDIWGHDRRLEAGRQAHPQTGHPRTGGAGRRVLRARPRTKRGCFTDRIDQRSNQASEEEKT